MSTAPSSGGLRAEPPRRLAECQALITVADFDEEATLRAVQKAFLDLSVRAGSGRATVAEVAAEGYALSVSLRSAPPHKGRFTILGDQELSELPPLQFLVDGILPEGAFAALIGAPGTGKSFCALDLCFCIATGTPWLGHDILTPGPTLLLAAEGATGIRQRVDARKEAAGSAGAPADVFYLLDPVNLLVDEDCNHLCDALQRMVQPPVLIVIDTLHRSMAGGEENSAKDMGRVIAAIDRLRRITGAAVLLIHHTVHDGARERGSSSLRGALDTLIQLQSQRGRLRLTCGKQKDGSPFPPMEIRLAPVLGSCVVQLVGPADDGATPLGGNELSILTSLSSLSESRERVSIPDLLRESKVAESSFYRSLKQLGRGGYVLVEGRGRTSSIALGEVGMRALRPENSSGVSAERDDGAESFSRRSHPPVGGSRERNRLRGRRREDA